MSLPQNIELLIIDFDVLCRWFMTVGKTLAVEKLQMRSGQGGHGFQHPDGAFLVRPSEAVSYTHLTLPTKRIV